MRVCLIVAMAKNRVIGKSGALPWHLPADLRRFKELTLGHPCIMGRKTFDSIVARLGRPLPDRKTIVISSSLCFSHPDVTVTKTPDQALSLAFEMAQQMDLPDVFVCGGAAVYDAFLPRADRLYVTEILSDMAGDVTMPLWPDAFKETERGPVQSGPPDYRFVTYDRH